MPQGAVLDLAATFRRRRHMLLDRLHTAAALALTEAQAMGQAAGAGLNPESPFTRIEVSRAQLLDSSVRAFAM